VVLPPPRAPVLPALAPRDQRAICELATASTIADYAWAGRGVAPIGYTKGKALAFAHAYRKLLAGHPAVIQMARAAEDRDDDALTV
jgi:hypothetical protein